MKTAAGLGSARLAAVGASVALATAFVSLAGRAWSFCHEMEVARGWRVELVATTPAVRPNSTMKIEWFGHATFQLTSSRNTVVLMDPHSGMGLRWPTTPSHVVTTSHSHFPHSNVAVAGGRPLVLHGLVPTTGDWNPVHVVVNDVSIYNVPAYHDKSQGMQRGRNGMFVARMDDICVAHLGDLGHLLTSEQLKMLGKIDVLLVPVAGGMYTVNSREARTVMSQVKPRIAIPMHYSWPEAVDEFVEGHPRVRRPRSSSLSLSKQKLPSETEIVVLSE